MKLTEFRRFEGKHCETVAAGNLLQNTMAPMGEFGVFGLGEGYGFQYLEIKDMITPFPAGRIPPSRILENLAKNLELGLHIHTGEKLEDEWASVKHCLDEGRPVVAMVDTYPLEYFTTRHHFRAHMITIHGYDKKNVYIADTTQQGGFVRTSLNSFFEAWENVVAGNHCWHAYLDKPLTRIPSIETVGLPALKSNLKCYLNEDIPSGIAGLEHAALAFPDWLEQNKDQQKAIRYLGTFLEKGGTGGANFRNLFRGFIGQLAVILQDRDIREAGEAFSGVVTLWRDLTNSLMTYGHPASVASKDARYFLKRIAEAERKICESLLSNLEKRAS